MFSQVQSWWQSHSATDIAWLAIGLTGQALFSVRWIAQWVASEKKRESTVPEMFWYLSFFGGVMVLAYGIYKVDPVIILGQFGLIIYARNLLFIRRNREAAAARAEPPRS